MGQAFAQRTLQRREELTCLRYNLLELALGGSQPFEFVKPTFALMLLCPVPSVPAAALRPPL